MKHSVGMSKGVMHACTLQKGVMLLLTS